MGQTQSAITEARSINRSRRPAAKTSLPALRKQAVPHSVSKKRKSAKKCYKGGKEPDETEPVDTAEEIDADTNEDIETVYQDQEQDEEEFNSDWAEVFKPTWVNNDNGDTVFPRADELDYTKYKSSYFKFALKHTTLRLTDNNQFEARDAKISSLDRIRLDWGYDEMAIAFTDMLAYLRSAKLDPVHQADAKTLPSQADKLTLILKNTRTDGKPPDHFRALVIWRRQYARELAPTLTVLADLQSNIAFSIADRMVLLLGSSYYVKHNQHQPGQQLGGATKDSRWKSTGSKRTIDGVSRTVWIRARTQAYKTWKADASGRRVTRFVVL